MVPEMSLFQNPYLHSKHLCKSVNSHRHGATDTSTRKLSNCEQNTLTRHIFSCFTAHISMSHVTLAQGVLRARHPCVIRMVLLS